MSVKADWHVDLASSAAGDPFGDRPRVERVGKPIELDDEGVLQARFAAAFERESVLHRQGVTCAIKNDPQTACSACPIRHFDPLDPLTSLCDVGCEEESLLTRLRILAHERKADDA